MPEKEQTFTVEQIRAAFWRTFHEAGEVWFNHLGDEETNESSTEGHWNEFLEHLPTHPL